MEVRQVLLARTIRLFGTNLTIGYLPDMVKKIVDRYEFVVSPKKDELFLVQQQPSGQAKTFEFKHGRLRKPDGRALVIQQLSMFNGGVAVDTTTSTEDSDVVLQDLIVLLQPDTQSQPEVQSQLKRATKLYFSQVEIEASPSIENLVPSSLSLGVSITSLLQNYGSDVARYQLMDLTFNPDPIGVNPSPAPFQLQRRLGVPYKNNIWFSQAPLTTPDHLNVLRKLEISILT